MFRISCAVVAAMLALTGSVEAKTARVPLRHVILAPGISVDIPDGWMACDPVSNKALHNAPIVYAIESFCKTIRVHGLPGENIEVRAFIDSDFKTKMMMGSFFTDAYTMPDEYISGATPQFLGEVEDVFCKGFVGHSGFPLNSCAMRAATVGGRPGFIGETDISSKAEGRIAGKFYMVSSRNGTMMFVFAGQIPFTAHVQAVMEEVAGSMKIEPPEPVSVVVPVPITPVPGLTMSVPKSWAACDSTIGTSLSPLPASAEMKASMCPAWLVTDHVFRAGDPRGPHFETVEISVLEGQDIEAMTLHMSAEQIARDHDEDCRLLSEDSIKGGLKLVDCHSETGTLAGHAAKIVTVLESGRPNADQFTINSKMRVISVPVGNRLFAITLMTTSALTPEFDATGEAVLNSIALQ